MKAPCLYAFVVAILLVAPAGAQRFSTFPDRSELRSPDGRFLIRSVDHAASASDFSGLFRCWCSRKRGVDGRGHSITTSTTSAGWERPGRGIASLLSPTTLASGHPARPGIRDRLARRAVLCGASHARQGPVFAAAPDGAETSTSWGNDHVFVEVSRVEGNALILRVWGYGARDPKGFRFDCQYDPRAGTAACREKGGGGPQS